MAGSEWTGRVKSCRSVGRPGFRASKKLPTSGRLIVAGLTSRQGLRLSRQKKVENASATEESAKAVPLQNALLKSNDINNNNNNNNTKFIGYSAIMPLGGYR